MTPVECYSPGYTVVRNDETDWGRSYTIRLNGEVYTFPSVSTILDVINRPELNRYRESVGTQAADEWSITTRDWGSQVHGIIERIARGEKILPEEFFALPQPVQTSLSAYKRWTMDTGFRWKHSEMTVFSLQHGFAGTLDGLGTIKNRMVLVDWKTGPRLFPTVYLQLAAYYTAYCEMYPGKRISEIRAISLNRDTGLYTEAIMPVEDVPRALRAFFGLLDAREFLIEKERYSMRGVPTPKIVTAQ